MVMLWIYNYGIAISQSSKTHEVVIFSLLSIMIRSNLTMLEFLTLS